MLHGLVIGNIVRIYNLCSDRNDSHHRIRQFYRRLIFRGYKRHTVIPLFDKALTLARTQASTHAAPVSITNDKDCVYLHLPYHPQGPNSSKFQSLFRENFVQPRFEQPYHTYKNIQGASLRVRRMIVAYTRPRNLRDIFSYRRINVYNGPPVSSYRLESAVDPGNNNNNLAKMFGVAPRRVK